VFDCVVKAEFPTIRAIKQKLLFYPTVEEDYV
jgi:hypothetical protein